MDRNPDPGDDVVNQVCAFFDRLPDGRWRVTPPAIVNAITMRMALNIWEVRVERLHAVAAEAEMDAGTPVMDRLPSFDGVDEIGFASSRLFVLSLTQERRSNLLLFGVEMSRADALGIIEALGQVNLDARSVVDFLLSRGRCAPDPFDHDEGDVAEPRATRYARGRSHGLADAASQGGASTGDPSPSLLDDHLWLSRLGERIRIDFEDIEWVAAEGAYVRLHVRGQSYLHRESMTSIAERLDPSRFVRVHRSHLARVDRIRSIRRTPAGGSEIVLRNGEILPIGRKYVRQAREIILRNRPCD